MDIIGSQASPFVRMTRIVCEELNLPYEHIETGSFTTITDEDHALINSNNPLMKVPILRDGETSIVDSRIIINYLINKAGGAGNSGFDAATNDEKENLITIILGTADAAVLRFLVSNTTSLDPNDGYLGRSYTRMETSLEYLNKQETLGKTFGVPELMLICVLDWFKKRGIYDWGNLENLVSLYNKYESRASVVNTGIPDDA